MATLPQLIEEDIQVLDASLLEFLRQTSATAALVIDKGGFLVTHQGDAGDVDFTTLGALASGAFLASQTIAGLVNEPNFNSTYQQGEKFSLLVVDINENCLLVILFKSQTGVGLMKYYGSNCTSRIARQLVAAAERNPGGGFDLSVLNIADPQDLFRKKVA
ncbi:MAG TPA: roadblock/LC7 domain-containing protein [Candidatus Angelobacter sp.]|jgi:predicted regulator of Ras-like GTPase activity (Roadblock/LC7/MglB family)|nr:roadblock/LC7 domain-containing protein [Candidatus Angelobacter sp.]